MNEMIKLKREMKPTQREADTFKTMGCIYCHS